MTENGRFDSENGKFDSGKRIEVVKVSSESSTKYIIIKKLSLETNKRLLSWYTVSILLYDGEIWICLTKERKYLPRDNCRPSKEFFEYQGV